VTEGFVVLIVGSSGVESLRRTGPLKGKGRSSYISRDAALSTRARAVGKGHTPIKISESKRVLECLSVSVSIDSRIVPSSFPNPVAELACVTRPWSALQEA